MITHILCSYTRGRGWRVFKRSARRVPCIKVVPFGGQRLLLIPVFATSAIRIGQFCNPALVALDTLHPQSSVRPAWKRKRVRPTTGICPTNPVVPPVLQDFVTQGRAFLREAPVLDDAHFLLRARAVYSAYDEAHGALRDSMLARATHRE